MPEAKNITWDETANRFYGHFDILGFKDMTQRYTHEQMIAKLRAIEYFKQNILTGDQYSSPELKNDSCIKSFNIGDTIIAVTKGDSVEEAQLLFHRCSHFIRMCITNKMAIKGAISWGKYTVSWNDSFLYGASMVDAVLLHDQLHMCGAVLDHNAERRLKELGNPEIWNNLIHYKTPMKSGKIQHYCLDWMGKQPPNGYPGKLPKDYVIDLYETASGSPRLYIDNTLEFITHVESLQKEK